MKNELVAIYVKIEELYCSYSSSPPSLSCFQAIFVRRELDEILSETTPARLQMTSERDPATLSV